MTRSFRPAVVAVMAAALALLALASPLGAESTPSLGVVHAAKPSGGGKAPAKLTKVVFRDGEWVPWETDGQHAATAFGAKPAAGVCPRCDNRRQLSAVRTGDRAKFPFASVALVQVTLSFLSTGKCTGTLIAPNRVLTAGHCVVSGGKIMTAAKVSFGVFGGATYGPSANVLKAIYFTDWSVKGLWRADQAVLYLDRKITSVPSVKYAPGSSLARGNAVRKITTVGYPFFKGDAFSVNNFRYASTTTAGYHPSGASLAACGKSSTSGMYFFKNLPIGHGMSGGPVFDVAAKTIVATNDLSCNNLGCNTDFSCVRGHTPISTYYSVKALASQK